jgi:U4/U6 small nuclear ribonucleoprotein PRP4
VLTLSGHVKALLAADWAPGGTLLATGAGDNAARVWDIRAHGKCLATLPAHASLLTAVRFEPEAGAVLMTASHDATLKVWSGVDWRLMRAVRASEGRIMAADIGARGELMASVSYDRAVKIWAAGPLGAGSRGDDAFMGDS